MEGNVEKIIKKHIKGKTFEGLKTETSIMEMENGFYEKSPYFPISGLEFYGPLLGSLLIVGTFAYCIFG